MRNVSQILIRPLVTEKSHEQLDTHGAYTFVVANDANKIEIAHDRPVPRRQAQFGRCRFSRFLPYVHRIDCAQAAVVRSPRRLPNRPSVMPYQTSRMTAQARAL